uniref:Uncharacterized protein n=1 Tax=Podoviridae sp. ctaUh10 TaxID=2826563 RepID=A0A8S5QSU8_9CAUD|nr:MAG TPA: hypothetical protein [Podoviridae sp. ctaUh10]
MLLLPRHMAQSLRWREHPKWVLSMNERYSVIIASSLGFLLVHRLNAEKLETATGTTFHHLDCQWCFPSVRGSEDPKHGVQSCSQRGGGGRIRLVIVGHNNDTHGVGYFSRLIVRHLYSLRDGIHHIQGFVKVFVELFGVLQCRVELDFALTGGGVDEVLDCAEFGGFGVECHECGVGVFHDIYLPLLLLFLFSGLCLKSFISHAVIIFNVGVSFVCMFFGVPFLRLLKSRILVKSFLIHGNLLRKNIDRAWDEIREQFLCTNRIRAGVLQPSVDNMLGFHKITVNKLHALKHGIHARAENIGFGSSQFLPPLQ